jgi:hypothetical protein
VLGCGGVTAPSRSELFSSCSITDLTKCRQFVSVNIVCSKCQFKKTRKFLQISHRGPEFRNVVCCALWSSWRWALWWPQLVQGGFASNTLHLDAGRSIACLSIQSFGGPFPVHYSTNIFVGTAISYFKPHHTTLNLEDVTEALEAATRLGDGESATRCLLASPCLTTCAGLTMKQPHNFSGRRANHPHASNTHSDLPLFSAKFPPAEQQVHRKSIPH